MPNRILRDYTDSLRFDGIGAEAERLFIRVLTKADDYGRFHADPRLVGAACFPLEQSIEPRHVGKWLDELERRGLLVRYDAQGKHCLAVINYGQRLKNSRVKFPPLPGKEPEWLPTSRDFPEVPGSSRDFPLESQSQSQSHSETKTKTLGRKDAVAGATASVKGSELSDEEWLKELAANPAYDGLDVPREFSKMQAWCAANRKQATRRRFVNWLNRVDKPLNGAVVHLNGHAKPESVWSLQQRIDAAQKEIDRIQANPANKEPVPDSFDRRLKAEPMAKVKALKASISEMRQRLAGVEVAA
jgi:hypothetical protein